MFNLISRMMCKYRSKKTKTGYHKVMLAYQRELDVPKIVDKWENLGAVQAFKEISIILYNREGSAYLPKEDDWPNSRYIRSTGEFSDYVHGLAYAKSLLSTGSGAAIIVEGESDLFISGVKQAISDMNNGGIN